MPADRFANEDGGAINARTAVLWVLPVALLTGVWLWLVFSSGGRFATDWAFPAVALGVVGIVLGAFTAYPRRPRQLSLAVLSFFAAYALWILASNLWAESTAGSWQASGRTFLYLLVLTLALTFFTWPQARMVFKYLLMAGSFGLLAACIWRLWSAGDLGPLFASGGFVFPIGQANGAAALFLVPFWPLMWLASGPGERAPVRGVALGLATGLVGLALLTQSRGAAWALGISLVITFAISPGRLRLLFYVVVPALLMVYAFPSLNGYWATGTAGLSGGMGARTLTVAVLAGGFMGMIAALLEKWVTVSGRMKAIFGTVVLAGCAAGLVYGAITLTQDVGGPVAWFEERWQQLTGEPAAGLPDGSAGADGTPTLSSTRARVWEAAWEQLKSGLVLGAGADNPGLSVTAAGSGSGSPTVQADSLVLRVLGETGIVGGVLLFGAMLASAIGILWPRTATGWRRVRSAWAGSRRDGKPSPADPQNGRSLHAVERRTARRLATRWGRDPLSYGWEMALLAAVGHWFVHANLERLWPMTGVTLPVLLILAAALAATDARARTMWPRLSRRLRRKRATLSAPLPAEAPDTDTGIAGGLAADSAPVESGLSVPEKPGRVRRLRSTPSGPLSEAFRIGLIVLSAATVVLAVSAYLLESL